MIGQASYIFELGCGLVLDGELEWLTDGLEPSLDAGTIYQQIEASGAPALLLERFAGRLEYHTPWSVGREVSHLFRGDVDLAEVEQVLASAGLEWLRLVDNGVLAAHGVTLDGDVFVSQDRFRRRRRTGDRGRISLLRRAQHARQPSRSRFAGHVLFVTHIYIYIFFFIKTRQAVCSAPTLRPSKSA